MAIPYDEELGVHPQAEGFTRPPPLGLRQHAAATSTRCCCTIPTTSCTARRSSSRPTSSWRCTLCGDRFDAGAEGARLRLLRGDHRARLVAVGRAAGHRRRRGRAPRAGLRLLRRDGAHRPARPGRQHARRPAPRRRWPGRGSSRSAASAACATTADVSPSRRGCPPRLHAPGLPDHATAARRLRGRGPARRGELQAARRRAALELVSPTTARRSSIAPGTPETRPLPPLPRRRPPAQPPGREPRRRHVEA